MKIRITHDYGADEANNLLHALVKFFGGTIREITPDEKGLTWIEYEIHRGSGTSGDSRCCVD